jgi:lipopolysaccharide transport system ATP-binding protein
MKKKNLAISVRSLGKSFYRTAGSGLDFFKWNKQHNDSFWALKDVSFDVERGTGLGIIGGNGAGKSTLLKILARIIAPTEGEAEIWGKVNSLLEVGTGFQADLSGRANIYLNASILGMSRRETDEVFDEIVAFSGVGEFIDMPVKHYSSGMYSRLAFSVAANVTGDILLVDEILSVGDAAFRKKCIGRMSGLLGSEHRTVLFVSHSMDSVMRFCSQALWLDNGHVKAFGTSEDVVTDYLREVNKLDAKYVAPGKKKAKNTSEKPKTSKESTGIQRVDTAALEDNPKSVQSISTEQPAGFSPAAVINSVTIVDKDDQCCDVLKRIDPVRVSIDCEIISGNYAIHPIVHIHCLPRAGVFEETHVFTCAGEPMPRTLGFHKTVAQIPEELLTVGQYAVSVALVTRAKPLIRHCKLIRVVTFQVVDTQGGDSTFLLEQLHGVIQPKVTWTCTPLCSGKQTA